MNIKDRHCSECGKSFERKDILPSGLCRKCSEDLIHLYSLMPRVVIGKIHTIQLAERNTPCFNTGEKNGCGQGHCEWQDICDKGVAGVAI